MKVPGFYDGGDQVKFQDELNQNMQSDLSDDGWVFPSQPETTIPDLSDDKPNGVMWYDETNHRWVGKENGVLVRVQTTPI
jgi:hypothetical protein